MQFINEVIKLYIHQFNILRDGKLWTGGVSSENYSSFQQIQTKPKLNQLEHCKDGIRRNVAVCRREQVHSTYSLKAIRDSSIGPSSLKSSSVTSSTSYRLRGEITLHWLHLHALLLVAQLLPFRVRKCSGICTDDPTSLETTRSSFLKASKKDHLRIIKIMSSPFIF